jgi:hypothetical protein
MTLRKILILSGLLSACAYPHTAMAADAIDCVAADLSFGTMESLGASAITKYTKKQAMPDQASINEFKHILSACATQWQWNDTARDAASDYSLSFLATHFAYNSLQNKKPFSIEPFYTFVGQMNDAEVKATLTTQKLSKQRQKTFTKLVSNALGKSATAADRALFQSFLMAELEKNVWVKRFETL